MRSTLFVLALFACGCGSKEPEAPAKAPKPVAPMYGIRTMQLSETDTSRITFESRYAKGSIEIRPGIRIGYASGVVKGVTHQSLTLDDRPLDFEGRELVIGALNFGALDGDVTIVIEPGKVSVNGAKRGDL